MGGGTRFAVVHCCQDVTFLYLEPRSLRGTCPIPLNCPSTLVFHIKANTWITPNGQSSTLVVYHRHIDTYTMLLCLSPVLSFCLVMLRMMVNCSQCVPSLRSSSGRQCNSSDEEYVTPPSLLTSSIHMCIIITSFGHT